MRRLSLVVLALAAAPFLTAPASASSTKCHIVRSDRTIHTSDFDITYPTFTVTC